MSSEAVQPFGLEVCVARVLLVVLDPLADEVALDNAGSESDAAE